MHYAEREHRTSVDRTSGRPRQTPSPTALNSAWVRRSALMSAPAVGEDRSETGGAQVGQDVVVAGGGVL